jgi:hypothetical protein
MPIQIDRARARDLGFQFDEALEIVGNEFEGLEPHRQYRNAFARVLKPDPLGRVLMMGTDQRDKDGALLEARRSAVRCRCHKTLGAQAGTETDGCAEPGFSLSSCQRRAAISMPSARIF